MSSRWFQIYLVRRVWPVRQWKWVRRTAAIPTLVLGLSVAAMAQGSPFDTGFNAIQALFTRHYREGCKSGCNRDRRLRLRARRTRCKKSTGRSCRRNGHCRTCGECSELALGCIAPFPAILNPRLDEGVMPDKAQQKHRTNRVFKSLHKPLTYLGVERTLFYFVCVGAVGAFNLFNSILAGIAVFIGGFVFGHRVTNSDPAFLRILASPNATSSVMTRPNSKCPVWRWSDAASRQGHQAVERECGSQ